MPFQFQAYRSPFTNTIADVMLRGGDIAAQREQAMAAAQARGVERSGQIWGNAIQGVGQIAANLPGQMQQSQRQARADEASTLQLNEQKRAVAFRGALSQAITSTPMVNEGGVSVYDIPAITASLPAEFRANADEVVKHLNGINEAFRQEQQARIGVVARGASSIYAAGSDPNLALHFIDALEKNKSWPVEDLNVFRQAIQADPSSTAKILQQFMPPVKMESGAPGSMLRNSLTGQVQPGSQVPDKPQRPTVVGPGAIAINDAGATVATGPPKEPTPKSYQKSSVLLDGKPTEILLDPTPGGQIYDLSGTPIDNAATRIKPIPPASVQVNNQYAAEGRGEISDTAKGIAEYRIPAPSPRSMSAGAGKALMEQVMRANPDYDASQFPTRQKMRIAFTSGPQSQTINSLNTAIGHLDQFVDVAKALDNGNFQPGNQAYNWLKTTFGDSAPTNFAGIRSIMSGELASAFKKSGATDQEIASVEQAINSRNSPSQLTDYVTQIALPALGSKVVSFDQQYRQVMGARDPFHIVLPESAQILQKYGVDPAHPTMGRTPSTAAAGRMRVIGPDGQTGTVPAGTTLPPGWKKQ